MCCFRVYTRAQLPAVVALLALKGMRTAVMHAEAHDTCCICHGNIVQHNVLKVIGL